jgi:hypothetical protein
VPPIRIEALGPNQRMKLTGAAILVSRGMTVLLAAPAAYSYRSLLDNPMLKGFLLTDLVACTIRKSLV